MAKAVKFWWGTREKYNNLGSSDKIDSSTRYIVVEEDNRMSEYLGTLPVTQQTGNLFPVKSVVAKLPEPSELSVGDRYLVGHDAETDGDKALYYLVDIAADLSKSYVNPLGNHSVRVIDRNMYAYQVVNGKLITYDGNIDCGTF